jgi:signal transduction histidine kinase
LRRAEADTSGRGLADSVWITLTLLNVVALGLWPSWDTIPFHLISIGFALLYGLRVRAAGPMLWGLGIVIITSFAGVGVDLLHDDRRIEEVAETPLLAAMFVVVVWHAERRISADYQRQLTDEKNARLLDTQRRFMQDASHFLRTPITIALTHAELLARNLSGRDLRDIQTVAGEITRLRRLSERLLVIAAAEDPEFLRTELVMLDEFAMDIIDRWRPAASRRWQLGRLDPGAVMADPERLGLAVDALLENAVRHTGDGDLIRLSVVSGDGVVHMVVADSGSGIEAGDLACIFDRFGRGAGSPGGGTGLGLALVRAVADAHGGTARVHSTPGKGSEFEITLPAVADRMPSADPATYRVPDHEGHGGGQEGRGELAQPADQH